MKLQTHHRPWPLPEGPWIMAQTWHDLLFAHWPVAIEALRKWIPPALEIDIYQNKAWIGIVPFHMSGVRLRGLPALPWLSAFPELNVRTYVTIEGKPGIYFFSLDAARTSAVMAARLWYLLPYFRARMSAIVTNDLVLYCSQRTHRRAPPAEFAGRYRPAGKVFQAQPGSLEYWLTERYCLYTTDQQGGIFRAEIHHPPWPLQLAIAEIDRNTMTAPYQLDLPATEPLLHFARRQEVVVWPLKQVGIHKAASQERFVTRSPNLLLSTGPHLRRFTQRCLSSRRTSEVELTSDKLSSHRASDSAMVLPPHLPSEGLLSLQASSPQTG